MSKPMLKVPAVSQPPGEILKRIALPLFLFSAVLLGFLLSSYFLILPQLTRVEVAGEKHDTVTLKAYVSELNERVDEMEEVRAQLVTPLRSGLYGSAKEYKLTAQSFLSLRSGLKEAADSVARDDNDAVSVRAIRFVPFENLLHVHGLVQNVGPRSMTMLAQFIDQLKNQEWVTSVTPPPFTRIDDPEKGLISPFTFQLKVQ